MSIPALLNGPIPRYNNPPIEPQFYSPSRFVISDIQLGLTTLVTVINTIINGSSVSLNYILGQLVRFIIPNGYGTRQLNEVEGFVIGLPDTNQFVVDINSQFFDQFIAASLNQLPQVMAIGDVNTGPINTNGRNNNITYIPGSFINISPI